MIDRRKERKEKEEKKEIEYCLYCGVNRVYGNSAFCSPACSSLQADYDFWIKSDAGKKKHG
jgi:hypothetical protein